jgi:hypothetical protein
MAVVFTGFGRGSRPVVEDRYGFRARSQPRQIDSIMTEVKANGNEPTEGNLPSGKRVPVDDWTCPAGQIKEVTGGSKTQHIARSSRCIPHGRK